MRPAPDEGSKSAPLFYQDLIVRANRLYIGAVPSPSATAEALPALPTLVLVPEPGPAVGADRQILGLGLARRAVLAARRAGYGTVYCLTRDDAAPAGSVAIADWAGLAAALRGHGVAPLVVVPATLLAETGWLERLAGARIGASAWAALPDRLALVAPAALAEALATLGAMDRGSGFAGTVRALTDRFGAPAALPAGIDPLLVAAPADRRAAERRLLRGLVKDTDGFMARHVERPMSLAVSRLLAATPVTPNQMTLFSVAVGLVGAPFFLSSQAQWQTAGALLLLAHSILDGCDGELARLRFQESRWGGILDFWGDNVVHAVVFACMALGWSRATGQAWPLALGAAAVFGTVGSASFVYWRTMRPKDNAGPLYTSVSAAPGRRLARLLDALSRRDFIYLVVACALFGKAGWFLVLAGLGAPIFFVLLLVLAARERIAPAVTPTGA
jgi:phosphatidylglycerophosphate synthase